MTIKGGKKRQGGVSGRSRSGPEGGGNQGVFSQGRGRVPAVGGGVEGGLEEKGLKAGGLGDKGKLCTLEAQGFVLAEKE